MAKAIGSSMSKEGCYLRWLLALFVIAILLALLVPGVSAGWSYRRNITINNAGDALSDYQVRVHITDTSNMQDNGVDLRFTDAVNLVKYPYWVESWVTDDAYVWVRVSTIPSGNSYMYMWYGYSGASSESNGDATFSFFDDFDNLDNWEKVKFYSFDYDHATISAIDGKLRVVSTGSNRAGPTTTETKLSQGQKTEAKMVTRSGNAETNQLLYLSEGNAYENDCYTTAPVNKVYAVWRAHGGVVDERWNGGAGSGDEVISYPYIKYRTDDFVHFGTREKGEVYDEDSVWNGANFKLAFYCCSAGTIEIDWVFVRKYDSTEPTITQIGNEESTGGVDPVPELPTLILFSVGLLVLAGYVMLRKRL